jgi:hypothetical protein
MNTNTLSWEQMEGAIKQLQKEVVALSLSEEARAYRESLFYPQFKTLCNRKDSEDCFNKIMVGPHNKPIQLPVLMDADEAGAVYKAALELQSEEEKQEMAYITAKLLWLHQRILAKRAKRLSKSGPNTPSQPGEGGPK